MIKRRLSGRLARVTIVATLVPLLSAIAVETTTTSAHASNPPCPSGYSVWDPENTDGIEWCQNGHYNLLVVDWMEGAEMRVVSEHVPGSGFDGDAEFYTRNTDEWASYIEDADDPSYPDPERLQFTVNAGFLITDDGDSTPLSLPEKIGNSVMSTGYAELHHTDPAWGFRPKFSLLLPDSSEWGYQESTVALFGDYFTGEYTQSEVYSTWSDYSDATVGYNPTTAPNEGDVPKNRTFFCKTYGSETQNSFNYILTNIDELGDGVTLASMYAEATRIGCAPGQTIQFDGGRSTQFYSVRWSDQRGHLLARPVPEVLALYSAAP